MNQIAVKDALHLFLNEDLGFGDLSSETIFPVEAQGEGTFLLKADGVVCGLFIAPLVYELLGGQVEFTPLVAEGSYPIGRNYFGKSHRTDSHTVNRRTDNLESMAANGRNCHRD
nr:hypothetical protein [Enterococcus durans]